MLGNFDEIAQQTLVGAKREMMELHHQYVGTEHLVMAILKGSNNVSSKLSGYNINYDNFKKEVISIVGIGTEQNTSFLYTPLLKRVIEDTIMESKEHNEEISVDDLFASLLDNGEGIAIRIFIKLGVDLDDLYNDFTSINDVKPKKRKDLIALELGVDLTKRALDNELDPVVGRDKEINRLMQILCRRTKNNPILIGEAGVGKTAIVEELARLIVNNDVPNFLRGKRIISLNMASLVAGTKYRGEFEERINKLLKELEQNDDIIIFIDEIHTLVGAGGAEGAIDASNIFKPALARNKIRCIGATTVDEYKKYIETDGALERRFQKINISIPDEEVVKSILLKLKPIYENFHRVSLDESIIERIIKLAGRYIYDRFEPDRSIDVMDEVCARVSIKETKEKEYFNKLHKQFEETRSLKNQAIINQDFKTASKYKEDEKRTMSKINNLELKLMSNKIRKEVTLNDVAEVINIKTGIPIYEIINDNKKLFGELKESLSKNIIGQDEAIDKLVNITKKIKLGLKEDNRCYSYLFVGPTGVGKTKLASLFASTIYGENFIKLDMSDYVESHSVSKIIGSPPGYIGYADNKNILEEIRNKPYSVLLLDEIEKAHPAVVNLFLQILDDGRIKDAKGKEVRFDNVIIIMTSNIGFTENVVGFSKVNNDKIFSKLKEYLSVEFINRVDDFVIFNKLSKESVLTIIKDCLVKLKQKYALRNIALDVSDDVTDKILEMCHYEEFGARKIDKTIKNSIESQIIDKVILGDKNISIAGIDIIDSVGV